MTAPSDAVWRPIPELPGYEASRAGQIRSLRRQVSLKATVGPCGFRTVSARVDGDRQRWFRVGTLVAEAWLGRRPDGAEVRRLDGDPTHDCADNLAYGTFEEVIADHAARAERERVPGVTACCEDGHRYADHWLGNWGARFCPDCKAAEMRRRHAATYVPLKPHETACIDCAAVIPQREAPGPPFLRCEPCRVVAGRASLARYRAKQRAPQPRTYDCADCHTRSTVKPGQPGPTPTRCGPCREAAHREADRRFRRRQVLAG